MTNKKHYYQEIEDILKSYNLSHNFIVSYALACAKDVNPNPNKETRKCFELLDKWLVDAKSVTDDELYAAANAASAASYAATYATSANAAAASAANAAYAATNAAYAASNAARAAANAARAASNAVYYAANAATTSNVETAQAKYKDLLLNMISTKYGDLGISLMNVRNNG